MKNEEVIEVLEKEERYMLSHGGDRQAKALRIAIDKIKQEPILEKDGTLIVTTEHCGNIGRVLVQYGTNGALFYQDQEPETVPVAVVKFDEDKLREIVQEKVDEIKENLIEQYLDKITTDIQRLRGCTCSCSDGIIDDIEDIIDKYKVESEGKR